MKVFIKHPIILLSILAELIILIILFPKTIDQPQSVRIFQNDDISSNSKASSEGLLFQSPAFTLKRGIYRIKAQFEQEHDAVGLLWIESLTPSFHSVESNEINIYENQRLSHHDIYIWGNSATVTVNCKSLNSFSPILINLSVLRTPLMERCLFASLLFIFLLVDFLYFLREKSNIYTSAQVISVFLILLTLIISNIPLFTDYINLGHDGAAHLLRIEALAKTLENSSQFPVRIDEYCLYEHGYAFSVFYPNLFLYFPAVMRLLGFPIMFAYKAYIFLINLLTTVTTYYAFRKCTSVEWAPLAGTILYVLNPYRLYNVYGREAVGEFTAMAFAPLIIVGIYLLLHSTPATKNYKKHKLLLIVGISGVLESHILSCEMIILFMIIVCIIHRKRIIDKSIMIQLLEAAISITALNAFFWMPFLYMITHDHYVFQDFIKGSMWQDGIPLSSVFQFIPYRGGNHEGSYHLEPLQIGLAGFLTIIFIFQTMLPSPKSGSNNKILASLKRIELSILALLFLTTNLFPWNLVTSIPFVGGIFAILQFPWRLLSPIACFVAFAATLFVEYYHSINKTILQFTFTIIFVSILTGEFFVDDTTLISEPLYLYNREAFSATSVGNAEYLLAGSSLYDYRFHSPFHNEQINVSYYEKNGLDVKMTLSNSGDSEGYVDLPLTGYMGYIIESENDSNVIHSDPYISKTRGEHGDLRIAIPAGYDGKIHTYYRGPLIFHISDYISLFSFVLFVIYLSTLFRKRKASI